MDLSNRIVFGFSVSIMLELETQRPVIYAKSHQYMHEVNNIANQRLVEFTLSHMHCTTCPSHKAWAHGHELQA